MKNKSAIRQMFYDNPFIVEGTRMNDEFYHWMDIADKMETELRRRFNGDKEMADLLEKLIDADNRGSTEECFCFFKAGLKFGLLLGIEITEE